MNQNMLEIRDLHAELETGDEILSGLNLSIGRGETHVIMGPNGAGKSTLANVIMGNPEYAVSGGHIEFEGEEINDAPTDERARKGVYLSFQTPEEVDGITMEDFIRTAKTAVAGKPAKFTEVRKELAEAMAVLKLDKAYAERYVNVGFSGGEKKKSEILQLLMLNPKLAILDETDSGLDVDAVKTVTNGVRQYKNGENALLIISHSTKLLEDMDVDYVHILVKGKIVHTGGRELIDRINADGFAEYTGGMEQ